MSQTMTKRGAPRLLIVGILAAGAFELLLFQNCEFHRSSASLASVQAKAISKSLSEASIGTTVLSPATTTVFENTQISISATNPPPGASFVLVSGDGQVDSSSGVYTAPNNNTVAVVALEVEGVSESNPHLSQITVIAPPVKGVALSPSLSKIAVGTTLQLQPVGGQAPYHFQFQFQDQKVIGSLDEANGTFTANAPGQTVVRVTDSDGNTALATILIEPPWQLF